MEFCNIIFKSDATNQITTLSTQLSLNSPDPSVILAIHQLTIFSLDMQNIDSHFSRWDYRFAQFLYFLQRLQEKFRNTVFGFEKN
jgi:hypothetical protein